MTGHVREQLLRGCEDALGEEDADLVARHLRSCSSCLAYDLELRRSERLLRGKLEVSLPPFRAISSAAAPSFGRALRIALATLVIGAVALSLGVTLQRARQGLALPSAAPSSAALATGAPSSSSVLVFVDHVSSSLILLDRSGAEAGRIKLGDGVVILPSLHPTTGQVALWRAPGRERQIPAELVLYDGRTTRVLATLTDLVPWSAPIWSADGRSLVFTLASPPAETGPNAPPRSARLVRLDLSTGVQHVLRTFEREWPVVPLVASAEVVAGLELPYGGKGSYVTYNLRTGVQLNVTPREEPYRLTSFSVDAEGRTIAGRSQRSDAAGPVTLLTWSADDYAHRTKLLEMPIMTSALFWPGRSEILVSGTRSLGDPYEALAVSESGSSRTLLRSGQPIEIAAVSPDGRALVMDEGISHQLVIYPLGDTGLGAPERTIARPASGVGLPGADFVGWMASH